MSDQTRVPALKGHHFHAESPLVPAAIKALPEPQLAAWLDEQNDRWAVVKQCELCDEPLVREELVAHRLGHVPDRVRPIARDLMTLSIEQRREVFALFDDGKLAGAE